ncbi:MAG: oligopeptidase B, partial [Flavobacterium sp.]|nr:oligopeptidase B [Flavobacterium sp.]
MTADLMPPIAAKKDTILEIHGDKRVDPYYWLNNPENPEVIQYLTDENEYYQKMTAHTQTFQKELFDEMKSRIKEDDESVPFLYNGYYYITRYEVGKEYPIYSRKKGSLTAPEEIMFDCNEMAKGHAYFNLGGLNVSEDNKLVSFATDLVGRRIYTLQIKNLETGEILADKITNVAGNSVWANDNKTLFYSTKDKKTLRSHKIHKHVIGTDLNKDELVFHEKDETFNIYIAKTKTKKFLVINSSSTLTSEFQILDANKPSEKFKVFQPRTRGLEYNISHFKDHFYIVTNKDNATNFKVMKTPDNATTQENWVDVITHKNDVLIEGIEIFKDYLVVEERSNGLNKIKIMPWDGSGDYYLPFEIETYSAEV